MGESMRAGFVGLGNMGRPMTRNLVRGGIELTVHDADAAGRARVAAELGCREAAAPGDFAGVDAVVTMLPTGQIVREVLLEWEGGLASALAPGTVVVDMSSSDPIGTRELGAELVARGISLVDAPVSGGVPRAETGTLAIMVGADEEAAVAKALPLLEAMGERIFRTGPLGSGHAMKALNNYVASAGFVAASEALVIGGRFGLDPAAMIDVMNASTGRNFSTERNFPDHVLTGAFATGFSLALLAKDIAIAADLADALGVDAPACALMKELWAEADAAEGPGADHTVAFRHWERTNTQPR